MSGREEKSKCQDCGKVSTEQELQPISDIFGRVDPGELMPSGECPDCGALCQHVDDRPLCPFCRNGMIAEERYLRIVDELGRHTIEAALENVAFEEG